MASNLDKLKKLSTNKLIDVVKNYRQHGYDEETRNAAIEILENRGIGIETLKLRGDFENKTYGDAIEYFKSYDNNSKIALVLYILMLISRILDYALPESNNFLITAFLVLFWGILVSYLIFFIKAFVSQTRYFNLIGNDKYGLGLNVNLYFIVGPFIYLVMFFIFRKQIKEQSKLIR